MAIRLGYLLYCAYSTLPVSVLWDRNQHRIIIYPLVLMDLIELDNKMLTNCLEVLLRKHLGTLTDVLRYGLTSLVCRSKLEVYHRPRVSQSDIKAKQIFY